MKIIDNGPSLRSTRRSYRTQWLRTGVLQLPNFRRSLPCFRSVLYGAAAFAVLLASPVSVWAQPTAEQTEELFRKHLLPILEDHCFECHSHKYEESSGQLMLDSWAGLSNGGARGPAVNVEHPDESLLLKAVHYEDADLQMPPDGKLDDESIQLLELWIRNGAPVPESWHKTSSEGSGVARDDKKVKREHWAYQLPKPALDLPAVDASHSTIDRILLKQLRLAGLQFSQRADRVTLVRRASYDLIGLPPTMKEVQAFVDDPRSDEQAMAALVDRLLASNHFGERWARYWMDIARYADNKGYVFQEDREYPEAFKYRDWLIQAFNQDMPYDEFIRKQLAADVLPDSQPEDLPALGFLTLGRRFLNNKYDIIDDRLDVTTRGLMGMTLTCARCHDHKYDPVTQQDYYALAGVFLNTSEPGGEPWAHRLAEAEEMRESRVLVRGNPRSPGARVDRRFVSFLDAEQDAFPADSSGRRELADCIATPSNPLTARVFANRVWMHLTGQSLVESPSDFGIRCPKPIQAELLDHLAISLVENRWSPKSLIRQIMLSRAYAQQSRLTEEGVAQDPSNQFYWRMNRRRLDFEALRDTLLVRTGDLDRRVLGKSESIEAAPFSKRRTVYAYIDRQNLPSVFRTFDLASPDAHSPKRAQTTVPQQGLFMLNSQFLSQHANQLGTQARRIAAENGASNAAQWLFQAVLARRASDQEMAWFDNYLQEEQSTEKEAVAQPQWQYGYGRFNPQESKLESFTSLPFYGDGQWKGGRQLPDGELGWSMLNRDGGHPGDDLNRAVVRRWTAPATGVVQIRGRLIHPQEQGDGVRGTILVAGAAVQSWKVHNGRVQTRAQAIEVAQGQAIDFVVDLNETISHDSFQWPVSIRFTDSPIAAASSEEDFSGPKPKALDVWGQLAQVLLASNELAFID